MGKLVIVESNAHDKNVSVGLHSDTGESEADAHDVSSPHPPSEKLSAPEPPRWRFINEAKKSLGYSSIHAGTVVEGQSSDELGAKYNVPDITMYQQSTKREKVIPAQREYRFPLPNSYCKQDTEEEIGKLQLIVPPTDTFPIENNDVGRLQIHQASPNETSNASGEFAGFPKFETIPIEPKVPFKEWGPNYNMIQQDGKDDVWHDGQADDQYSQPNSDDELTKTSRDVGLKFHDTGSSKDIFVGQIPNSLIEHDDSYYDDYMREGALFLNNWSTDGHDSTVLTNPTYYDRKRKKKRYLYILLLLLLLMIVILIILLWGKKNDDMASAAILSVGGGVAGEDSAVPSSSPSDDSSIHPSTSPSMECPMGFNAFSIKHAVVDNEHSYASSFANKFITWKIKNACTGDIVTQCKPCPISLVSPMPKGNQLAQSRHFGGSVHRLEQKDLTHCLQTNNEYVFEILSTDDSEQCCGFDASSSIVSYDDVVIHSSVSKMYFGKSEKSCISEMPSTSQSAAPSAMITQEPSSVPSTKWPSYYPTKSPIVRQRTRKPTWYPTPQPVCSTEKDFNMCLAVDMSGSVCNDGTNNECINCQRSGPTFFGFNIPFLGTNCRDSFVSQDTCCSNFANVKGFSSTMVNLLDDFPAEKTFSVVQFATNAQLVSSLASADQTVQVIDQLDYTGGLTNHASAIQACQQTLPSNDNSRKNFIMLITDGVSSEPGFDPEGEALAAARVAKSDGTFIVPVFISPDNDWSALSFMRRLSSDGKVFDVTDFDSLSSLQDSLITEVSCS